MSADHKRRSGIALFLAGLGILLGLSIASGFWGDAKLYVPVLVGLLIGQWWAIAYAFFLAFLDVAVRVFSGAFALSMTDWDSVLTLAVIYAAFGWLGMALRKVFETFFRP